MRDVPISVVLTWPTPNYVDPQTRGQGLTIINTTLVVILVIVIALRYYTRLRLKKWFGLDDWFIGLALISSIGLNVTVVLADERYGWNKHIWDVPYKAIGPALKTAMLAKLFFTLAATFTRTSLLCFYQRLIANSGIRWFRAVLIACHVFVAAVGIAFVFLVIFQCNPVSAYWTYPAIPSFAAHCMDEGIITLVSGAINSFADLLVTVVPIPIIMRLQMPKRQRIGVMILLSLGFVVTAIGLVRTYFIWYVFMNTYDETWWSYPLYICATVEIDVGVICACIPSIRPLFNHIFHKPNSSTTNSPHNSNNSNTSRPRSKLSEKLSATLHVRKSPSSTTTTSQHDTTNNNSHSHSRSRDEEQFEGEELVTTRSFSGTGAGKRDVRVHGEVEEVEGDFFESGKGIRGGIGAEPRDAVGGWSGGGGGGWTGSGKSSVRGLVGMRRYYHRGVIGHEGAGKDVHSEDVEEG